MICGSRPFLLLASFAAATTLLACASADAKKKRQPVDPGDEFGWDESPTETPIDTQIEPDSGAFGAPERPAANKDAGGVVLDAGSPDASDGGPVDKTYCLGPLAAGDLAIVELMISSRSGSGDDGEWVEIRSTRDCWLVLDGVAVESPRGTAAPNVATVAAGLELAPGATFVVAGSADPGKNHGVPAPVFAWNATDVLKNDGDTVTVKAGGVVVDTLTYPALSNLTPGRSLAFPSDCAAGDRADWQRWSLTFASFAAGFQGTPNAPNADVACF
jgi:hypothetical protein